MPGAVAGHVVTQRKSLGRTSTGPRQGEQGTGLPWAAAAPHPFPLKDIKSNNQHVPVNRANVLGVRGQQTIATDQTQLNTWFVQPQSSFSVFKWLRMKAERDYLMMCEKYTKSEL